MEKKNDSKVIFRGTILGVFFFIFSRHRGRGGQGGFKKCQTFFFLKASLKGNSKCQINQSCLNL